MSVSDPAAITKETATSLSKIALSSDIRVTTSANALTFPPCTTVNSPVADGAMR